MTKPRSHESAPNPGMSHAGPEFVDIIHEPWTPEQVMALNINQRSGFVHPYTCGGCENRGGLVATTHGWVCLTCDYTQDWAHLFSTEVIQSPWPWDADIG